MKNLLVLGLWLAGLLLPGLSHASWNAEWKQRIKISLNTGADGLALSAPVDAVPLLVRLHTGNFPFIDAKPDGSDLRFIAADDKTPLKFHIEKFDGLNELALVWVQLPKLAAGAKSDFVWVYYGNPNAPPASDPKTSYDAAQALVFHFGEREGVPQDATANANHASASTAAPSAAGLIGGGLTFDGTSQLTLPAAPSLKAGPAGLTLSLWVKPVDAADAPLAVLGDGVNALRLSLRGGKFVAQAGALTATSTAAVAAAAWQHLALVVKDGLVLYVNGVESARAAGVVPDGGTGGTVGKGFKGDIDELQMASTARSADWIKVAALSQGQDQKLVSYGAAEGEAGGEGGASYLKVLLGAVTLDGWVVIGILMVMFIISSYVMASKAVFVSAAARDNDLFKAHYERMMAELAAPAAVAGGVAPEGRRGANLRNSSLYRLYLAGANELRTRFEAYAKVGRAAELNGASINAIRATVDATYVRETQRLNSQMVLLTICISGGPFLGLLGTVVGVMITFAAIAAAGDVNVNAIAPGIAAALVATVAGLAVAIPALFGYNYLTSKISELSSDMQVFIDEFVTRLAESHAA
jgi:biopolymer transport protein ExbB